MINDLGWDSLESRRCNAKLTLFYKIINGLVAVNPNDFLTNGDTRTRSDNHRKFMQIQWDTPQYCHSFFVNTICDWNKLSDNIVSSESVDTFRASLHKCLD